MYETFPEWGPAKNNPDSPAHHALHSALDPRDTSGQRPDDN